MNSLELINVFLEKKKFLFFSIKNSFINSKEFSKLMDLKGKSDIRHSRRAPRTPKQCELRAEAGEST